MTTDLATKTNPRDDSPSPSADGTTAVSIRRPEDFQRLIGDKAIPAIHNFTGDGMAQWRMTALATNGQHGDIKDAIGKEIKLRHFYAHAVQLNGDTPGEIVDAVRTVLFDVEGRSWAFVSEGIAAGLAQLIQVIGFGPWSDPPVIKVVEGQTRAKRRFYSIVPA